MNRLRTYSADCWRRDEIPRSSNVEGRVCTTIKFRSIRIGGHNLVWKGFVPSSPFHRPWYSGIAHLPPSSYPSWFWKTGDGYRRLAGPQTRLSSVNCRRAGKIRRAMHTHMCTHVSARSAANVLFARHVPMCVRWRHARAWITLSKYFQNRSEDFNTVPIYAVSIEKLYTKKI